MVQPVFEELAQEKKGDDIVFAKIDMGVAPGGAIAGEWSVRITPTFLFFLDGKLVNLSC
jgi:thiol-disulfide isomerase/thioredoxin